MATDLRIPDNVLNAAIAHAGEIRRCYPHTAIDFQTDVSAMIVAAFDEWNVLKPLSDPSVNTRGAVRRDARETSTVAADLIKPITSRQRLLVLGLIYWSGTFGRTDYENEQAGLGRSSASTRRRELELGGWVADSGSKRLTSSGRFAIAWTMTPQGKVRFRELKLHTAQLFWGLMTEKQILAHWYRVDGQVGDGTATALCGYRWVPQPAREFDAICTPCEIEFAKQDIGFVCKLDEDL